MQTKTRRINKSTKKIKHAYGKRTQVSNPVQSDKHDGLITVDIHTAVQDKGYSNIPLQMDPQMDGRGIMLCCCSLPRHFWPELGVGKRDP